MAEQQQQNPAEQDYNMLIEMAQRLGLDEQESEKFIKSSMTRFGYKPRTSWDPPEENNNSGNDDGDFFSGKGKQREQRNVRGDGQQQQQQQQQRGGSAGWQYE